VGKLSGPVIGQGRTAPAVFVRYPRPCLSLVIWGLCKSKRIQGANIMEKNEIAFIKQSLRVTKEWDDFQALLRRCRKIINSGKVEAAPQS
jgi:hypothetical protein